IAQSKQSLELIIYIATSFYNMANIKVNSNKSTLTINTKMNNMQITFNQQTIQNIPPDQAFRFLGCKFFRTFSYKPTHIIITDEITAAIQKLQHAKIIDKQAIYIINSVILTRFAYQIQNTFLSSSQLDKITKSYTNLTKHKVEFASTIPSSTLFYN
ncbi:13642_t:CDS:1, partial [Ambispora leptoticha]